MVGVPPSLRVILAALPRHKAFSTARGRELTRIFEGGLAPCLPLVVPSASHQADCMAERAPGRYLPGRYLVRWY